jgi:hypothetical protein
VEYAERQWRQLKIKRRLAVQSGLAEYGRNNITYVAGMGSNVRYAAFYTDIDGQDEVWRDVCNAEMCADCGAYIKNSDGIRIIQCRKSITSPFGL